MTLVTLSSQNQITIPVAILRDFQMQNGGKFLMARQDDKIVMEPIIGSLTDKLAGSLNKYIPKNKLRKSWKTIMAKTQQMRAKHLAEE